MAQHELEPQRSYKVEDVPEMADWERGICEGGGRKGCAGSSGAWICYVCTLGPPLPHSTQNSIVFPLGSRHFLVKRQSVGLFGFCCSVEREGCIAGGGLRFCSQQPEGPFPETSLLSEDGISDFPLEMNSSAYRCGM